jgi:hypothetical protein
MFDWLFNLVGMFGDGVYSAVAGLAAFLAGVVMDNLNVMLAGLPGDIFQVPTVVGSWETGIRWLNWFVPVGQMAATVAVWASATVTFYVGKWALRLFVKSGL